VYHSKADPSGIVVQVLANPGAAEDHK
jgi:hypothetical protein